MVHIHLLHCACLPENGSSLFLVCSAAFSPSNNRGMLKVASLNMAPLIETVAVAIE